MADDDEGAVAEAGRADKAADGGATTVELLTEIRDLHRQNIQLQVEHRQWLLLRVLVPMFAMIVILVVLAVLNTR